MSAIFENLLHVLSGAAAGAVAGRIQSLAISAQNVQVSGGSQSGQGTVQKAAQHLQGLKAVSNALESFGIKVSPVSLELGALGTVVDSVAAAEWKAWKELKAFSAETLHARETLRQFNGVIATAYAKLDLLTLQQNFAMGSATSVSTEMMVESWMRMLRAQQPAQQLGANISNLLSSAVNEMSADITSAITAGMVDVGFMLANALEGIPLLSAAADKLRQAAEAGLQAIKDAQNPKVTQTPWGRAIIERGQAYEGPNMPPLGGR